jgi:DNA-binding NarL/FixJ family response regulator
MQGTIEALDTCPVFVEGLYGLLAVMGLEVLGRTIGDGPPSSHADLFLVDDAALADARGCAYFRQAVSIAPVLVRAMGGEDGRRSRLVAAGAVGVVDRAAPVESVVATIRDTFSRLVHPLGEAPAPDRSEVQLSRREREVLQRVGEGLTTAQIATALQISPHTVDTYIKRIRTKLGSGNKADLTRAAIRLRPPPTSGPARGSGETYTASA